MEIRFKLTPVMTIYPKIGNRYRTKHDVELTIARAGYVLIRMRRGGEIYYIKSGGRDDNRYVIHMEKRRDKYAQRKITRGKNKGKTESTLISAGGWYAKIYAIPKNWPVKVIQHSRHFEITGK